jgi:diguanylate cyclase (GGDEF)-like protein
MKQGIVVIIEADASRVEVLAWRIQEQLKYECVFFEDVQTAQSFVELKEGQIIAVLLNQRISADNYSPIPEIPCIVVSDGLPVLAPVMLKARNVLDYVMDYSLHNHGYFLQLIKRAQYIGKIRVLVVENESMVRTLLANVLGRAGFKVLLAKNGKEGLAFLEKYPETRLVLTDMDMPVMDGEVFIRAIRSQYSKQQLPIIGLADSKLEDVGIQFLRLGANDFVPKPPRLQELLTRVMQNLEIAEGFHEINELSRRDFLTGLYNRRHFYDTAETLFAHLKRGKMFIGLVMIDIDNFKLINDTYGHAAGDQVLIHVAEQLKAGVRETDVVSRFGGEEFCILLAGLDKPEDSQIAVCRIIETIRGSQVTVNGHTIQVTVSAGVCTQEKNSLDNMIMSADHYLYEAKNGGKDQAVGDWPR